MKNFKITYKTRYGNLTEYIKSVFITAFSEENAWDLIKKSYERSTNEELFYGWYKIEELPLDNMKNTGIDNYIKFSSKKPPLGLVPKFIRQKQRFNEICEAISRYYNEGMKIPLEWIDEYNELVESMTS